MGDVYQATDTKLGRIMAATAIGGITPQIVNGILFINNAPLFIAGAAMRINNAVSAMNRKASAIDKIGYRRNRSNRSELSRVFVNCSCGRTSRGPWLRPLSRKIMALFRRTVVGSRISPMKADEMRSTSSPFQTLAESRSFRWRAARFHSGRRDGRELFYFASDNRLMAVPIAFGGPGIKAGVPVPLFSMQTGWGTNAGTNTYAASADGQRFLINALVEDVPLVTVLFNWRP
jgi:hypothetical protein